MKSLPKILLCLMLLIQGHSFGQNYSLCLDTLHYQPSMSSIVSNPYNSIVMQPQNDDSREILLYSCELYSNISTTYRSWYVYNSKENNFVVIDTSQDRRYFMFDRDTLFGYSTSSDQLFYMVYPNWEEKIPLDTQHNKYKGLFVLAKNMKINNHFAISDSGSVAYSDMNNERVVVIHKEDTGWRELYFAVQQGGSFLHWINNATLLLAEPILIDDQGTFVNRLRVVNVQDGKSKELLLTPKRDMIDIYDYYNGNLVMRVDDSICIVPLTKDNGYRFGPIMKEMKIPSGIQYIYFCWCLRNGTCLITPEYEVSNEETFNYLINRPLLRMRLNMQ